MGKMHADEVDIDSSLVARLLAGQFPQWGALASLAGPICWNRQRDLLSR